jgi:hypothetical protein
MTTVWDWTYHLAEPTVFPLHHSLKISLNLREVLHKEQKYDPDVTGYMTQLYILDGRYLHA